MKGGDGLPRRPLPSLPVSPAANPRAPTPLLAQPYRGRGEIEQCRHQSCYRHQRLCDLPTHLLPPSGRATLRTGPDAR